jgi:hypothetical protein
VLSVVAILLSSSQAFIFSALNTPTAGYNSSGDFRRYLALIVAAPNSESTWKWENIRPEELSECVPRWKMVFTWQAPMMLMAYAVAFFLAGLTVYICTPLFNGEVSTPGAKVRESHMKVQLIANNKHRHQSFTSQQLVSQARFLYTAPFMLTDSSILTRLWKLMIVHHPKRAHGHGLQPQFPSILGSPLEHRHLNSKKRRRSKEFQVRIQILRDIIVSNSLRHSKQYISEDQCLE